MRKKNIALICCTAAALALGAIAPSAFAAGQTLNLGALNGSSSASGQKAPAQAAPPTSQCKTQPTSLTDLGSAIGQIDSGKKLASPVILSAKQLLTINPDILQKLKSDYAVLGADCQTVPVVGGQLIQPAEVDFAPLAHQLILALRAANQSRVKFLVKNFTAAPVSSAAGLQLIQQVPYSKDTQKKLTDVLGVQPRQADTSSDSEMLMSDLFLRLGGKVANPEPIVYTDQNYNSFYVKHSGDSGAENENPYSHDQPIPSANLDFQGLLSALTSLGFPVSPAN